MEPMGTDLFSHKLYFFLAESSLHATSSFQEEAEDKRIYFLKQLFATGPVDGKENVKQTISALQHLDPEIV